jgi:predicted DsbA family dithiol-disulfide isomerase
MAFEIDVISDIVCPWCFIGKRHLERALEAWRDKHPDETPTVRWHPFQLKPQLPAGGMPRKQYLENKFGGPERAREIYARVEAAGARAGIAFAFGDIRVQPNTIDAHRLVHHAARHDGQDAMAEALFRRYFLEGADLSNREELADIAQQAGMDREEASAYLAGDADRALIE